MMKRTRDHLEERLAFHERQMQKEGLSEYWRNVSEKLYWFYLNILTNPEGNSEALISK